MPHSRRAGVRFCVWTLAPSSWTMNKAKSSICKPVWEEGHSWGDPEGRGGFNTGETVDPSGSKLHSEQGKSPGQFQLNEPPGPAPTSQTLACADSVLPHPAEDGGSEPGHVLLLQGLPWRTAPFGRQPSSVGRPLAGAPASSPAAVPADSQGQRPGVGGMSGHSLRAAPADAVPPEPG